jgi:hypothetical protein
MINNDDQSMVEVKDVNGDTQDDYTEGEYDGEGEYSSDCSWSSCLREKNADNAVSLKLSQYSYMPTNGPRQGYENDSLYKQTGGQDDDVAYNMSNNMSQLDRRGSKDVFPDNLSNGQYKMSMGPV